MKNKDIETLKQCRIFSGVDEEFIINSVLPRCEIITLEKNTVINVGERFKVGLTVIINGEASVFRINESKRIFMSRLVKGCAFGMSVMFGGGTDFPTEIKTLTKCRMCFINQTGFENILKDNFTVSYNYISVLSDKIRYLNKKLDLYTSSSVNSAFASYLINSVGEDGVTVILDKSLTKTADTLNIGRASLYRAINYFEENNCIKKDGNKIIITDFDKLTLQE